MPFDSIDETLRKAFETSWNQGRREPIERFLPPADDAQYLPTLEELVHIELEFRWKDWRKAHHSADTVAPVHTATQEDAGPPRVENYLNRFPQLDEPEIVLRLLEQEHLVRGRWGDQPSLDEYRQRFPQVVPSDWQPESAPSGFGGPSTVSLSQGTLPTVPEAWTAAAKLPRRFGNYELLDELGRGGMGIVYRARQLAAERIVALKVVRRDYLQSLAQDTQASALERFHQEVQAAAQLDHPNIVAVYEVGDVGGEPFYTMRYVKGNSLSALLRDGPVPNRQAADYAVQVAQAISEAHRHGILHRDLKPQNILIDGHSDRPLVTDFGLAKLLTSSEDLTQSGDIMGSPPYMSPEQARDSSKVTTQTDVYAIGATLYHVLSGRAPFHAATALETLCQVTDQEPVPPRELNPAIDRDLETICLKCLEKEPNRRYESAHELAEEIGRYLRNEPIQARPVGTFGRTARWCRRNPIVATLITSTLAFLVLALVATLVGYVRTTAALKVAETSERHARQTVDEFFTSVSEDTLLNQPGMQPLRRELLEKALKYYRQFLRERGNDASLQDELALTHFRIGRITEAIDAPQKALQAYQQALTMQEKLLTQRPTDLDLRSGLGDTYSGLGRVLVKQREWDEAAAAHRRAAEIRRQLVKANPDVAEFQRKLASSFMNLGVVHRERGELEAARDQFLEARSLRRKIRDVEPEDINTRRDLAMGCYNLANLYLSLAPPDVEAARANLQEAIDSFEAILREQPGDLTNQYRLAISYRRIGDLDWMSNRLDAAGDMYRQAIAQIEPLARDNPDVPEYQASVARLNKNVGLILSGQGQREEAVASFEVALPNFRQLVQQYPNVPDYAHDLASTLQELALLQAEAGQLRQARDNLAAARKQLERLAERFPEKEKYARLLEETKQYLKKLDAATE